MFSYMYALFLFALSGVAFGAVYTDPSQLNGTKYDFVVVGAGLAGNVIATRLTENPAIRVLVIEAGVSNTGYRSELLTIPFLAPQASVNTPFDWNLTTQPQQALNNRVLAYSHGFVVGGGSSTNFLAWTRGSSNDFDRFASVVGDDSFSWAKILPYLKKSEQHTLPSDGRNDTGEYNPLVHGMSGPILFSTAGNLSIIDSRVLATTSELSGEFPFNLDTNSGYPLGIGWQQSSVGHGVRSSSATAYLTPALQSRSNIDLLIETRVTKLVRTGTSYNLPEFKTVEVAKSASGSRYQFTASKEIVLSAGAIGSPQILMLSGIGDASQLSRVGIKPIVYLPEVGKNLQDHPIVSTQWTVQNDAPTYDVITLAEDPNALAAAFAQYNANQTGILSSSGGNHMGFFRLPSNSSLLRQYGDPTAGPVTPHFELAWQDGFVSVSQPFPTSGRYVSNINVVSSPTSRGFVVLNSSDPFAAPIVDPKFLSTDFDLGVMVYAIRAAQRFIRAHAWDGYVTGPYIDSAAIWAANATDASIVEYIRKWTASIKHPFSTVAANKEDGKGVLKADLTVKNMKGVRVVDGSVFPFIPSGHPQAAIYGVAELAADKIKAAYGL